MLNLILGRPGSGKTYNIRNIIKKQLEDNNQKIMLIVPEQNSFLNEKEFLNIFGEKKASQVEILSFTRLANLIFTKTGGLAGKRLDDGGRNILMSLAIESVQDQLKLYKDKLDNPDLINLMISILKEFKMCNINSKTLMDELLNIKEDTLKNKITEASIIIDAYESLVKQSFIDPLDDLTKLANKLLDYEFFKDYEVFIDDFNGFTMQELEVLKFILVQSKNCYITLRTDTTNFVDNGMNLFSPVNRTANRLLNLAKENNVKIAKPILLESQFRLKNKELKAVEKEIFSSKKNPFLEEVKNVVLYNATNIYDESEFIARTIKKHIIENSNEYSDFAVIARMTDNYKGIIDAAFSKYNIPYFMDNPEPIDVKPLTNLVLMAFEIVHSKFSSDYIFKYLKTDIAGLNIDEVSILENYVLLWSINKEQWFDEFTLNPNGFSEKMSEEDKENLKNINLLREQVIKPLENFRENIKDTNGLEISKAVYKLLEEIKVKDNIKLFSQKLIKLQKISLAQEQLRLWDLLIEILDQIATVLKNKNISSVRYFELLKLIINSNDISFIPHGLDQVIIGSADRSRPANPKIVFIIGANEGEFPRNPVTAGIFTDHERKYLISLGLPMYDNLEKLSVEEKFLAYVSLASPSEKLYVTWPGAGLSGESKLESVIVRNIKKILPKVLVYDETYIAEEDKIWSKNSAFESYASNFRNSSSFLETLNDYFSKDEDYKLKISAINRAANNDPITFNDTDKAAELFGGNLKVSASQIEKYYLCKFQYFCMYGLKAKKRKSASFDALEYGSLMHFVLENILSQNRLEKLKDLSEKEIEEMILKILHGYVESKLGGIDNKTSRFKYLFYRLVSTAKVLIIHIVKELLQSEFSPVDYELDISNFGDVKPLSLKLPDGSFVNVQGKIDRLDIMKKDGKSYIRIIDYKTGIKEFQLSDIIYGLNVQMLVYLATIYKNGKNKYGNIVPAGILYMPANKPLINSEKDVENSKIENEVNKKLRMNGLILDDPSVITGMENDAKGVFIPVKLKDGKPSNMESVVSLSQMGSILKYIESLVVSMAETLKLGDISAVPAVGRYEACEYCVYSSVCGYEKGNNSNLINKFNKDDVMKKINGLEDEK